MKYKHLQSGVSLAEVVVAAAIIVLIVLSLVSAFAMHLRIGLEIPSRIQATLLTEEGIEALKYLRDESWSTNIGPLSLGTPYYLYASSTGFEATTTEYVALSKFYRTFALTAVERDADGIIVSSGGTLDDGTRRVDISVSWSGVGGTTTNSFSIYITNLFIN